MIEMGDDFLRGYTGLVDGEKDPRNLLLAFSIDRVICIEFDISRVVEVNFLFAFCANFFDYAPDDVQYHLLLFSDHIQTSRRRSLWYHG